MHAGPADLTSHLAALLACDTFDAGGDLLLSRLRAEVDAALRPAAPDLEILAGLIYLRGAGRAALCHGGAERPSLTTWRRVQRTGRPVVLDVLAGGVALGEPTSAAPAANTTSSWTWAQRPTTHALTWPLRAPGLGLCGMVSLEVQTEADAPVILGPLLAARDHGQLWVDLSAPALLLLPRPAPRSPLPRHNLPFIGPELEPVLRDLADYSAVDDGVILLTGATGTGKTTVARWCHDQSSRAGAPFVVARLHERPDSLHHSALFGWARGAYTGATGPGQGWIEEAQGGTLFIDEIDKLSLEAQGALLSLLDTGTYCRLGESKERRADVRILVGTNADLEQAVAAGRFLHDLYYRVNVLPVRLPSLRERPGEVGPVAEQALRELCKDPRATLSDEARELLLGHAWPGNLRELHTVIKRAYAFARSAGWGGGAPVLGAAPVRRALAMDHRPQGALPAMEAAATALLHEIERRRGGPHPLDLDHADALRGMVLRQAVDRHGLREAYAVVGQGHAVEQNNQHKLYQRQLARVEALEAALRRG